jgi:2'-5' RNA ligase
MAIRKPLIPGYTVCDYMILIDPGDALAEKILAIRHSFNNTYKVEGKPWKPNLLLASFKQYVMMEERIVNKLNIISMAQQPLKIELKDYGSFPSHSVYINVTSKLAVQEIVKKIRTEAQSLMKLGEDKPYFALEPHIMIAKKLKPWQYEKSWLEYSQKHFTGRFITKEMLLLKRYEGDKSWQVVKHFQFQNLPVETKQGELF